jgi:hypothetical protein
MLRWRCRSRGISSEQAKKGSCNLPSIAISSSAMHRNVSRSNRAIPMTDGQPSAALPRPADRCGQSFPSAPQSSTLRSSRLHLRQSPTGMLLPINGSEVMCPGCSVRSYRAVLVLTWASGHGSAASPRSLWLCVSLRHNLTRCPHYRQRSRARRSCSLSVGQQNERDLKLLVQT